MISSPKIKNIPLSPVGQINATSSAVSDPQEGRFAIVTSVGCGMRWTFRRQARVTAPDETAKVYGEVVWSWRRDAGVKSHKAFARRG
jgi:hypothetical protein